MVMNDVVPKNAATPVGKGIEYRRRKCGYRLPILACKHKIQKLLNNLVCRKQNSVDQSSKDFKLTIVSMPMVFDLIKT